MDLTSQPSVNDLRGRALNTVFGRMQQLDLTPLLVYRIDSVPTSALPFLAWQFDVASAFWQLLVPGAGVPEIDGGVGMALVAERGWRSVHPCSDGDHVRLWVRRSRRHMARQRCPVLRDATYRCDCGSGAHHNLGD